MVLSELFLSCTQREECGSNLYRAYEKRNGMIGIRDIIEFVYSINANPRPVSRWWQVMNAKENESGLGNLKVSSLPRFPTNFQLSLTIPLSCHMCPPPLKKKKQQNSLTPYHSCQVIKWCCIFSLLAMISFGFFYFEKCNMKWVNQFEKDIIWIV